eukprot:Tamp_25566.p1 GENE.Tamp_25566~~Tamp_25566.p1  ORF type:complete len:241 (-),score=54.19 Tamp_25566:214-936(-)
MPSTRSLAVLALASGAQAYIASAPGALPKAASQRCNARPSLRMAEDQGALHRVATFVGGLALSTTLMLPLTADAGFQLPPIDKTDKSRCQFKNSAMGQSNAAKDKLYDLRQCDMEDQDAKGFDIAGAIMLEGNFAGVNFKEVTMSKVLAQKANFDGADFSNAVMDRGTYKGSSFKGAVLQNAVLSGSDFTGADLTDSDFSDAYMGDFDNRNLCKNPTLKGTNPTTGADTRASAACKAAAK